MNARLAAGFGEGARVFARGAWPAPVDGTLAAVRLGMRALWLPFDAARAQHARCVRAGMVRRSMLDSRDFESSLGLLERLTLGPLARRV